MRPRRPLAAGHLHNTNLRQDIYRCGGEGGRNSEKVKDESFAITPDDSALVEQPMNHLLGADRLQAHGCLRRSKKAAPPLNAFWCKPRHCSMSATLLASNAMRECFPAAGQSQLPIARFPARTRRPHSPRRTRRKRRPPEHRGKRGEAAQHEDDPTPAVDLEVGHGTRRRPPLSPHTA